MRKLTEKTALKIAEKYSLGEYLGHDYYENWYDFTNGRVGDGSTDRDCLQLYDHYTDIKIKECGVDIDWDYEIFNGMIEEITKNIWYRGNLYSIKDVLKLIGLKAEASYMKKEDIFITKVEDKRFRGGYRLCTDIEGVLYIIMNSTTERAKKIKKLIIEAISTRW